MTEVSSPSQKGPRGRPAGKKSGVIVPHAPRWHQRLAAWLIAFLLRSLALTLRYRWNDPARLLEKPPEGPLIFCLWHNRLALCMSAYRQFQRGSKRKGLAAMVSASRDGAFLSAILTSFGVQPVRGSSSRRGPQALLELTSWAQRGYDLAITPDGPRGPCYVVQDGVASLAQLTGLTIIPFSYSVQWKIRAKSWDRFIIPLPFSRCVLHVGQPIAIPREASPETREALRRQLENALREISPD